MKYEINKIEIDFSEVEEDLSKVIPSWMDETNGTESYFNLAWNRYTNPKGQDMFGSLAGLKKSINSHIKEDAAGIPSGKVGIKYTYEYGGGFKAWINYNSKEAI